MIAKTVLLPRRADLWAATGLGLILALAAYLRLANNANTPGWYTDEGTHLEIAHRLAQGRTQYLAIQQSTFLFAKLPLFELLLATLLDLAGGGMAALRTLTGSLGVISVALLYGLVRWTSRDIFLALIAALMLAIYPQAVLYSRFGFSYNLLAPLLLLAYLGIWQYLEITSSGRVIRDSGQMMEISPARPGQTGSSPNSALPGDSHRRPWLAFTALVIGLGGLSDLWMLMLAAPLLIVVLSRRRRDALWSIPLLFLPFGLYLAFMLLTAPEAFLFDLHFTAGRLSGLSPLEQLGKLAANYAGLLAQDPWLAVAVAGLFLLRPARLQLVAWLLLGSPILLLGRTEALYHLSFYYMIPLLPLISLGMAAVLRRGVPYAVRQLERALVELRPLPGRLNSVGAYSLVLILATTPFLTTTINLARQTRQGFTTAIDPFLIDPRDARYVAGFVNRQTDKNDLVIASPGLAWMLEANAADFQMAVAFNGQATPHLPADIPPERFAFVPDYSQARFVVVDNLWYAWAIFNVQGVPQMLETIRTWRISIQSGNITVYCNPNQPDC